MSQVIQFPGQKQKADAFTRDKMRWLDTMVVDRTMSADAFRLAYLLASKYLNRRRGYAFPSQEQLGVDLGVTDRQVRRHLGRLISAGYVRQKKGGTGRANEYRIAFPAGPLASGDEILTGRLKVTDRTSEGRLTGPLASAQPFDEPSENPLIGRPTAGQPTDWRSTLDGSRVSRLGGAPLPRRFYIGFESTHPKLGDYTVVGMDRESRRLTIRVKETGDERSAMVRDDDEFADPPDDLDDEIPF